MSGVEGQRTDGLTNVYHWFGYQLSIDPLLCLYNHLVNVIWTGRRPKPNELHAEYTWKHRTTVVRSISPLKPWARSILVGDPALLKEIYVGTGWLVLFSSLSLLDPD